MRQEPLKSLETMSLKEGVERSVDPKIERKISFWRTNMAARTTQSIGLSPHAPTLMEGDLAFTKASMRDHEIVDQTMWQKFRGLPPENTITGPAGLNVREITAGRREALLVWMKEAGVSIDDAITHAWPGQKATVSPLGPRAATVENLIPIRRTPIVFMDYVDDTGPRKALSPMETKKQFDEGMQRIFAGAEKGFAKSDSSAEWTAALGQVERMRNFYAKDVGWGEERDGMIRSMESRGVPKSWCVALSPESPRCGPEGHILSVNKENGLLRLLIQPWQIDDRWAGLFMIHELTHMERMANGTYVKGGATEYANEELIAYQTEYLTAMAMTEGKLERWLDAAIATHGVTGTDDIISRVPMLTLSQDLDALSGCKPPKNPGDASLRGGFYTVAMALRLHEKLSRDPMERTEKNLTFIKRLYADLLPKA